MPTKNFPNYNFYTEYCQVPIQAKQSEKVGRNKVDKFETSVRRYWSGSRREKKGVMVAFSFTDGAYDEAKRSKIEEDINIKLMTVDELTDKGNSKL